jgi:hypothetical protein
MTKEYLKFPPAHVQELLSKLPAKKLCSRLDMSPDLLGKVLVGGSVQPAVYAGLVVAYADLVTGRSEDWWPVNDQDFAELAARIGVACWAARKKGETLTKVISSIDGLGYASWRKALEGAVGSDSTRHALMSIAVHLGLLRRMEQPTTEQVESKALEERVRLLELLVQTLREDLAELKHDLGATEPA